MLKISKLLIITLLLSFGCEEPSEKNQRTAHALITKDTLLHSRTKIDSNAHVSSKTNLPIPIWDGQSNRYEHIENYTELINNSYLKTDQYDSGNNDEGAPHRTIFLPSNNWDEVFLITKKLFFIPESYALPKKEKEVHSTPNNPSINAIDGPYDYVDQYFELNKDSNGSIIEIKYYNLNEVGDQIISITKSENGFVIKESVATH